MNVSECVCTYACKAESSLGFLQVLAVLILLAQLKMPLIWVGDPEHPSGRTRGQGSRGSCFVPMHVGGLGCQKNLFSIFTQLISALPCRA